MSKSPKHAATPAQAHNPGLTPNRGHDDDELHVPKGLPRWTSIFLIALMIFLLVIWLVPGPVQGLFKGNSDRNPVSARWERPGHGTVEMLASDLQREERALRYGFDADQFLAYLLGINPASVKIEELVRLLVLDQLAKDAGIEVTDADLATHIRETLGFQRRTEDNFKELVHSLGADQTTVEESIRRLMRISRFQQMLGYAAGVPDPKAIEEMWEKENVEFSFDYVTLPVESLKEEARLALPKSSDLQTWFDALAAGEREEFKTPEKRKAEFAVFRPPDEVVAPAEPLALVTKYPEKPAEGAQPTAPDELAHQYYNRVAARRFLAERKEGEDATTEPAGVRPFEEVQAVCLAEAPIYFSLQRWLDDLKARKTAGETIDFRAEADSLGLDFESTLEARTREQYGSTEFGLGGDEIAEAVFTGMADGSFYFSVVAGPFGLVVARVNERTEPADQPFDVIHDRVAEKWLGPKCTELAEARLDTLRKGLESFEPAPAEGEEPEAKEAKKEPHYRATGEVFRAAAQAAGLEVQTRDWLNKAGPASRDPQWEQDAHKALFSQANQWGLYELVTDEVGKPGTSMDEKTLYLVREAGNRKVPLENMSPAQYKRYKQMARERASSEVAQGMDVAFLRRNYHLWLRTDDQKEPDKAPATKGEADKGNG